MGTLLPAYKKALVDELIGNISSNTNYYYIFTSDPVPSSNGVATLTNDIYSTTFTYDWKMLFGKKIQSSDIIQVIKNIQWQANTVYTRYDNTKDISNSNFYVLASPAETGGYYNVYKCIDNANGAPSQYIPDQIQTTSFQKSDGYIWRYITSISSFNYNKFYTTDYTPIYTNTAIASGAADNSSVDVIVVSNTGAGYSSYADGIILSNPNSTIVQISDSSSNDNDFYTLNGIYLYNNNFSTSQLKSVSQYIANTSGKWIYLDSAANTQNIIPNVTSYKISPKVVITSDGTAAPSAYSVINATSNSIGHIVIIDGGANISWANVSLQSNTNYGTGAVTYAIIPPPGGHGSDPATELYTQGFCVSIKYSNTEVNTLPVNINYNKIGIIKNPYGITANNTKSATLYNSNTFVQVTQANVSSLTTFNVGDIVKGVISNAVGIVAFSNTTVLYLTGDKSFKDGEQITSGNTTTFISINTNGSIYAKDINPLYVRNVTDVARSNSQTEAFKLVIQV